MLMFQTEPYEEDAPKRRRKSERPSSSGMLYFILAFVICLVLFAGIGVLWWHIADPEIPFLQNTGTTAATTTTTQPVGRFSVNDRFSVAVYITDNDNALQTVSLALFKPDTDNVSVIPLPAELALPDADTDTLARRFATGGADAAQMALSAYIGKPLDYYVVLSYNTVESYFTQLSAPLVVKLPKDVDQQSADGSFSIHLSEGEQALTPKQIANLLRCDNWQAGKRERANMHATVVSAYINQFIAKDRALSSDHTLLASLTDTNLTGERFSTIEPPLSYLANLSKDLLCTSTNIDGNFAGAGGNLRFHPDASIVDAIKNHMK